MTAPNKYPFFSLVENQCQAEATLAALACFGNCSEKTHFKPKAKILKMEYMQSNKSFCLAEKVNTMIAEYIEGFGDLSDQLTIFIGKSIK